MTVLAAPATVAPESVGSATGSAVGCAHCSLDVPKGRLDPDREEQFCCAGCEAAYDAIRACGLDEYYTLRERLGGQGEPVALDNTRFVEFDDPSFTERHVKGAPGGALVADVYLQGVHCAACLWLIERLPRVVEGLVSADLDLRRRIATLRWDPAVTSLSQIAAALARVGYTPHPVEPSAARDARRAEDRAYLVRIGVAGACAGNVMLLAFALYSGRFDAMDPIWTAFFRWLSAGIGLVSVFGPGRVFMRGAVTAMRARSWHLDMPIALALAVGAVAGLINVIRGGGEIYFDSLAMLVFLLLLGRWLQMTQHARAADAVELLFSVTPRRATLVEGDAGDETTREVAIDAVRPGDLVEVGPQCCAPVDGLIERGATSFDESILTGESRPVERAIGDEVAAGAVNLGSAVRVRVAAAGRDTRVGKLMATLEGLSRGRAPVLGQADRLAGPFVIGVLVLSVVCVFARLAAGAGMEHAIESTVALLVVCCPCAIALSTPLACAVAMGRLASRGTLVKGGHVFEALARPGRLVLDKTGTLTEGRFEVRAWSGDVSLKPVVAAIEHGCPHPIARSLAAMNDEAVQVEIADIEHRLGLGGLGWVQGARVAVGSSRFMRELGVAVSESVQAEAAAQRARGRTVVYVSRDAEVAAVVALGDEPRPGAAAAIDRMRALGMTPEVLSGDDPTTTERLAEIVGVETFEGHASPERKAERVGELMAEGPVVAVGDGVNDAAALASATVGIAVHGGAEASLAAADVYLSKPGLAPMLELMRASRATTARIRLCLIVAGTYNVAAAALAITGYISPVLAAVLMPVSSASVVALAAATRWKGGA
ncbi:MAG: heavy metal translocating P-type ATPase [Planctomycetota bacterium]